MEVMADEINLVDKDAEVGEESCRLGRNEAGEVLFSPPLYIQRYRFVLERIKEEVTQKKTMKSFVDLGCSECRFLQYFRHEDDGFEQVYGLDIDRDLLVSVAGSFRPLVADYLGLRRKTPLEIELLCGSIEDCDPRLYKVDVVSAIELIEHLYPPQLQAFPKTVFGFMQPKLAIITTPNIEYNALFRDFKGPFRHWDHKFEWTRAQFEDWCRSIIHEFPEYTVEFDGVGYQGGVRTPEGPPCSQIAVFSRVPCTQYRSLLEKAVNNCTTVDMDEVYESIAKHVFPYDDRSLEEKIHWEALFVSRSTAQRLREEDEELAESDRIFVDISELLESPSLRELCDDAQSVCRVLKSRGETIQDGKILVEFGGGDNSDSGLSDDNAGDYDDEKEAKNQNQNEGELVEVEDKEETWD